VWNIKSSKCYAKYTDFGNVRTPIIANCPRGIYHATGSELGVVNLYQLEDHFSNNSKPKPVKEIMNLTTAITSLEFNHDSQLLCMVSDQKPLSARMLHVESRTVYKNFNLKLQNNDTFTCASFSPNSQYLALGGNHLVLYKFSHYSK